MPGFKAHLAVGAVVFAVVMLVLSSVLQPSILLALQYFFCTLLGALFPDFDTKSRGQTLFYRVLVPCLLFVLWQQKLQLFILLTFIGLLPLVVKHRGLLHKKWFVMIVPPVVAILLAQSYGMQPYALVRYALFFSLGALSHIILDFKK